jgi:N6-L-threonylcarbamoyladenine synthase
VIFSLGIETSCDECSVAVVALQNANDVNSNHAAPRFEVKSLSTYSQIQLHRPYGGVVPEVASRNHFLQMQPVLQDAVQKAGVSATELDVISVTNRPGLMGALLVGVTTAKTFAYAVQKPLVPVHHLAGHLISPYLNHDTASTIRYPAIFLMVSGGHTQLHLVASDPANWEDDFLPQSLKGKSIDDAAGEAFDKTAKTLGFPYPGGAYLDRAAVNGNPQAFAFPRALSKKGNLEFSFSGLKTAVATQFKKCQESGAITEKLLADLAASTQAAIVDSLIQKSLQAVEMFHAQSIVIVGGVSANSELRRRFPESAMVPVIFPDLAYSTDNAAMIAAVGAVQFSRNQALTPAQYLDLNAYAF